MWTQSLNKTWSLIFSTSFFNKYAATSAKYHKQYVINCLGLYDRVLYCECPKASLNVQFHDTVTKTINQVTEPYEFYEDETPLSSDETPSFNDPAKSVNLLMWYPI